MLQNESSTIETDISDKLYEQYLTGDSCFIDILVEMLKLELELEEAKIFLAK